ncbi:MAG: hypothetical protein HZB95_01820 [Nitrosomonadales bacterium]|nr:hypothetical protein [Nitrosomonadales bacterium]
MTEPTNKQGMQISTKLTVEQLKTAVAQGISESCTPADEVFDRLEAKYRKLATVKNLRGVARGANPAKYRDRKDRT